MDGVYVIYILVELLLSFYFFFFILEELYLMVHTFIIQIIGFQELFFSFFIWNWCCLEVRSQLVKFYNLGNQLLYLGFYNSIHQEVASDSFCFLINSSWLLVFILFLFLHALGLNLYCWNGIHFS
jgi:hypothetical protein